MNSSGFTGKLGSGSTATSYSQNSQCSTLSIVSFVSFIQCGPRPGGWHDGQVSSATSYPAFRNPVLPGAAKCGADRLGSDCPCGGEHFVAKLRIAIEQQERASG